MPAPTRVLLHSGFVHKGSVARKWSVSFKHLSDFALGVLGGTDVRAVIIRSTTKRIPAQVQHRVLHSWHLPCDALSQVVCSESACGGLESGSACGIAMELRRGCPVYA